MPPCNAAHPPRARAPPLLRTSPSCSQACTYFGGRLGHDTRHATHDHTTPFHPAHAHPLPWSSTAAVATAAAIPTVQVSAMVDTGADVSSRDPENITCLHWAAINNRTNRPTHPTILVV